MLVLFCANLEEMSNILQEKFECDLLFLAAGACASDPLSEFCNDLQTAPDEVSTMNLYC